MKKLILLIITICLLFNTKESFGQMPNLGAASSYSLFTGTGSFTNVGSTVITGNIGSNIGPLTGFPPGIVNGQIHVADAISATVAVGVDTGFNSLGAYTCDSVIGITLGNGQILTPKVYCIGAASYLNGNLTLNGQGNPNALFIFKITGALSTSSFASVTLINGASLSNVYWRVDGAFNLANNSVFRGTVITSGAINLYNNASLLGRGLAKAGSILLDNNISSLPVTLLSFKAIIKNKDVLLNWSTTSETNNDYFTLEKSDNGINYNAIKNIKGAGNSTTIKQYNYTDIQVENKIIYYKLKQTDLDGKYKYFNTIVVNNDSKASAEFSVYPNPSNGVLNLFYKGGEKSVNSVSIYDAMGTRIFNASSFQANIDLSSIQKGIYFLHVNMNDENIVRKIVIDN